MSETMLHLHLMNTHGADFAQAGRLAINGGSCPACAGQHDINELLATTTGPPFQRTERQTKEQPMPRTTPDARFTLLDRQTGEPEELTEAENDIDYHPWRCGANCEVCADR